MTQHKKYKASITESQILDKYLADYANSEDKSDKRNSIVNNAYNELHKANFMRWDRTIIRRYFNNNKNRGIDYNHQLKSLNSNPNKSISSQPGIQSQVSIKPTQQANKQPIIHSFSPTIIQLEASSPRTNSFVNPNFNNIEINNRNKNDIQNLNE